MIVVWRVVVKREQIDFQVFCLNTCVTQEIESMYQDGQAFVVFVVCLVGEEVKTNLDFHSFRYISIQHLANKSAPVVCLAPCLVTRDITITNRQDLVPQSLHTGQGERKQVNT